MKMVALLPKSALFTIQLLLRLCLQSIILSHAAMDSMTRGSTLTAPHFLVSANGTFVLGLFSFSSNTNYVGVWYAAPSDQIKLWVANRNLPAADNAFLQLSEDGSLKLCNHDGTVVWRVGENVERVVLLDTGNLVLYSHQPRDIIVWQSFDEPTNTLLAGMHFGLTSSLTSWKSTQDPASGRFSFTMLGDNETVSVWNGSVQYWKGALSDTNEQDYTISSDIKICNYRLIRHNEANNSSFTFYVDGGCLTRSTLEEDGVLRTYVWGEVSGNWHQLWQNPANECQVQRLCGPNGVCDSNIVPSCKCPDGLEPVDPQAWNLNDWSLGCIRIRPLGCRTDEFMRLNYTFFGSEGSHLGSQNQRWCENACLRDCACTGYAYSSDDLNDCILYNLTLLNGVSSSGEEYNFFLRVAGSQKQQKNMQLSTIIKIISGAGIAILIVGGSIGFFAKKIQASRVLAHALLNIGPVKYSYKDLQKITKNFSQKIGSGGFCTVYEGKLVDNSLVAVKKLSNMLKQREKQFFTEVSTIGKLQHVNLVILRGYCAEGSERLLVYEHLCNGSLDRHLFGKSSSNDQQVLDWNTRFSIALGTARGIAYLHEKCMNCIIHCDIKPDNILLDVNFCAKVSDFGLAKLFGHDLSQVITTTRGTRGYLAPEWLENMPITAKADVYSYGMTLLEIISGRKNVNAKENVEKWFFPTWAYKQVKLGNYSIVGDEKLGEDLNLQQLKVCVQVAFWCIQDEAFLRPAMSKVVNMLEGIVEIVELPPMPKSLALLDI